MRKPIKDHHHKYGKKYINRLKKEGLCIGGCGTKIEINSHSKIYVRCLSCRSITNNRAAKNFDKGLCKTCGVNAVHSGKVRCLFCIERSFWTIINKKYNLSKEKWEEMYLRQEGNCDICKLPGDRPKPGYGNINKGVVLCVDHDHGTGKVRSLLHLRCNGALGLFRDNPDILISAANYIKKHRRS